jgi:hypothetical protein
MALPNKKIKCAAWNMAGVTARQYIKKRKKVVTKAAQMQFQRWCRELDFEIC